MNLEDELRHVLKRTDPPEGFERRILTRIASHETVPNPVFRARWHGPLLRIAAVLVLASAGTYYVQQRELPTGSGTQVPAERATEEVILALRIASQKVAAVQAKVQEMNHDDPQTQP